MLSLSYCHDFSALCHSFLDAPLTKR